MFQVAETAIHRPDLVLRRKLRLSTPGSEPPLNPKIVIFPRHRRPDAGVDREQVESRPVAVAAQPVQGPDEIGGRGEPFDRGDLGRSAAQPGGVEGRGADPVEPGEERPAARFAGGLPPREEGRVAELQGEGLAGREEGPVALRRPNAELREQPFHLGAAERREQRIGGAVVASGDHQGGEAVEGHGRALRPVLDDPGRQGRGAQRDHVAPAPLAGLYRPDQLGEDEQLEGRSDRERAIRLLGEESGGTERFQARRGQRDIAREPGHLAEYRRDVDGARFRPGDDQSLDEVRRPRSDRDLETQNGAFEPEDDQAGGRTARLDPLEALGRAVAGLELGGYGLEAVGRDLGEEGRREESIGRGPAVEDRDQFPGAGLQGRRGLRRLDRQGQDQEHEAGEPAQESRSVILGSTRDP